MISVLFHDEWRYPAVYSYLKNWGRERERAFYLLLLLLLQIGLYRNFFSEGPDIYTNRIV